MGRNNPYRNGNSGNGRKNNRPVKEMRVDYQREERATRRNRRPRRNGKNEVGMHVWLGGVFAVVVCIFTVLIWTGRISLITLPWIPTTYELNVEIDHEERGSVTGAAAYEEEEEVTLTAQPNYGYEFAGWYDGDTLLGTELTYIYEMPGKDYTLQARFGVHDFRVSVSSGENGFTNACEEEIPYLSQTTLHANEIDGMAFVGWYSEGKLLSQDVHYTFSVEKDMSIRAEYFFIVPFELLELPTAEASRPGALLADVGLLGGSTTVPGEFRWTYGDIKATGGEEYLVTFEPLVQYYSPAHYMVEVPVSTASLSAPKASLSGSVLSWKPIEGAESYTVRINDEERRVEADVTALELPTEMNEYCIQLRADGNGETTYSSDFGGTLRYVPFNQKAVAYGFGGATSEYENGELKKYGGSFKMKDAEFSPGVEWEEGEDYYRFKIAVDIAKHIKETTKREVLKINGLQQTSSTQAADVSVTLVLEVTLSEVEFYGEFDMNFPIDIEDLAFGISYQTLTSTVSDICINGEFVQSENRRSTLNLLFIELVGLEEPIYKWAEIDVPVPGTGGLASVELAVGFDALGAVAAALYMESVETTEYRAGIQIIKDGEAVLATHYDRDAVSAQYLIQLAGELDFNINFLRISATLQLRELSLVRLNLDLFNLETDLSGTASMESSMNAAGELVEKSSSYQAELDGAYRLYGQITFEYYLELRFTFFMPLDSFKIKLMDGSYILAEWELAKGGIPKTSYQDEAASKTTPIFAADGSYEYYKNAQNSLMESRTDFSDGVRAAFLSTEEIVDIDNHYVYVFGGGNLRRVGRYAGTERTVVPGVERVLGSDRNFIYYTLKGAPQQVRRYYRTDYASVEPTLVSLPSGWSAIRLRYDYALDTFVIYAEKDGGAAYFDFDGYALSQHSANEHKYWDKKEFSNGAIAYYSMGKDLAITECFIRYPNGGVTHEDNVLSLGITEQGLFIVKEKQGGALPFALGLYAVNEDGKATYTELCEVADQNTARRVGFYDGKGYFADLGEGKIRIFRTNGETAELLSTKTFGFVSEKTEEIRAEMHDSWLFVYSYASGKAKTLLSIDVETLRYVPYIANGAEREYDKGEPKALDFELTERASLAGFFLSKLSEEELRAISDSYETLEKYEDVKDTMFGFIEDTLGYDVDSMEKALEKLQSSLDLYQYLNEWVSVSLSDDGLTITVPADALQDHEYGLYHGYIVTTGGVYAVYVNIVDSRAPAFAADGVEAFDKKFPQSVTFGVYTYDEGFTLDAPASAYGVCYKGNGLYEITLYPEYLAELAYGENTITLTTDEGETLLVKLNVSDSRSPVDDEYYKTFDKSYAKNVTFTFSLYDEKYITGVSGNDVPQKGAFTVNSQKGTIVFRKEYLSSLFTGEYTYQVTTAEKTFEITVRVINTLRPTAATSASFDLASANNLGVDFAPNDAYTYDVYMDGEKLIRGEAYAYDDLNGKLLIFNEYMQKRLSNGTHRLQIRGLIASGDEIKSAALNVTLSIADSRTPSVDTSAIHYAIVQEDNKPLRIRAEVYGNKVVSVTSDSGKKLAFSFDGVTARGETDYRGGYIVLPANSFVDILEEGARTLTVKIGDRSFAIVLNLTDERRPEAIETTYWYDILTPSTPTFTVRFYGEEFVSVSGNGITEGDYAMVSVPAQKAHVLMINTAYIQSLDPAEGQLLEFVVLSKINYFRVTVRCFNATLEQPPVNNVETKTECFYVPTVSYSTPAVSPEAQSFDKGAPNDLAFTVDYGHNNSFGSILCGGRALEEGAHYVLGENGFTLTGEYLSGLGYGTYTFRLKGALGGKFDYFYVTVTDSRAPFRTDENTYAFDRYDGDSIFVAITLYDSIVKSVQRNGDAAQTSGFAQTSGGLTLHASLLKQLALGENVLTVAFNDCTETVTVLVTVSDTGLYYGEVLRADKAVYTEASQELTMAWTLYQGEVTAVENLPFTLVSYSETGLVISGLHEAEYGSYTFVIKANGHEFEQTIVVFDSRKPYALQAEYEFDKGAFAYTLDPTVAATYDLSVELYLYDEAIDGEDILSNQTIHGNGLAYGDYKRVGNSYTLSYLYLYRLRIGEYTFGVDTTDGTVQFVVKITDSRAPELLEGEPVTYDYAAGGNRSIPVRLHGEEVSSVSYVHYLTGEKIALTGEDYHFGVSGGGNEILVLHESLLQGFYMNHDYEFEVATTTERTLTFTLRLINGPVRPFKVVFYSVPWESGEPQADVIYQTVFEGEYIEKPEDPVHPYYDFLGWYSERSGGYAIDFTKPVTEDMNIFLHWKPKTYTITLMSDGEVMNTLSVDYLSPIPEISDPTRTGYTFVKWAIDEDYEIRFTQSGEQMPHESFTVYAEWTINYYTVVFKDSNGVVLKEEVVQAYGNATPPDSAGLQIEHYVFNGWSGSYTSVLYDRTLTATYEAEKYAVTYVLDGGTNGQLNPAYYTVEDSVEFADPIKRGYTFLGWYTEADFSGDTITDIPFGSFGEITLYAKWQVNNYFVHLESEYPLPPEAEDNMQEVTYDASYTLPVAVVPEGMAFMGWYSGANGTGTKYTEYDGVSLGVWKIAENTTFYAYVIEILEFSNITIDQDRVSFSVLKYVNRANVTFTAIELLAGGEVVASIETLNGFGTYSFANLEELTEYEIRVSFDYDLQDNGGVLSATRSFTIQLEETEEVDAVTLQTVAEIKVRQDEFASLSVTSIVVKDEEGNVAASARTYGLDSYALSYLNNEGPDWIYVGNLAPNAKYTVEISYTYTLYDYVGTYHASFATEIETAGIEFGIVAPVPSMNTNRVREYSVSTGAYTYTDYYQYQISATVLNSYIENELRLLRWEQCDASGTVLHSGEINSYVPAQASAFVATLTNAMLTNGATYTVKLYYAYDLQDGNGMVEATTSLTFSVSTIGTRDETPCLVSGTKVLMADGTEKNVEDVEIGEYVRVWNFETGKEDVSRVTMRHELWKNDKIFYLNFANGERVGVGVAHGFFTKEDNRFVSVSFENAEAFVGKHFALDKGGRIEWVKLESVTYSEEGAYVAAIITADAYNHLAAGFLSMVQFVELVNMFEVDGERMCYDEEKMAQDLATYGVMSYDEWKDYLTYQQYEDLNGGYMGVLIGKGIVTFEYLIHLIQANFPNLEIG